MHEDFLRYSCQVALPGFGLQSQLRLQQAKALVVGAGGLGCPAAQYLAAAGIGTLGIADFDTISISNLHRQVLYSPAEAGLKKAVIAGNKLSRQNPQITIVTHNIKITPGNALEILNNYDIIVDCTDNFDTRYLLNDACIILGKPIVYGAIYQYEGQVAVWNVANTDGTRSPNYRDIFPQVDASKIPNCAEGGVIPTIAGIVGCMQANEVIKYITNTGELLAGKILIINALTLQSRIIKVGAVSKSHIKSITQTTALPLITASELTAGIGEDSYVLVDVRSAEERAVFNIGGMHIPLADIEINESYLAASKPVVFYCATGKRSAEAAKKIKAKFPAVSVFSLAGGLDAWQQLH